MAGMKGIKGIFFELRLGNKPLKRFQPIPFIPFIPAINKLQTLPIPAIKTLRTT
jgi:hypothetical protein